MAARHSRSAPHRLVRTRFAPVPGLPPAFRPDWYAPWFAPPCARERRPRRSPSVRSAAPSRRVWFQRGFRGQRARGRGIRRAPEGRQEGATIEQQKGGKRAAPKRGDRPRLTWAAPGGAGVPRSGESRPACSRCARVDQAIGTGRPRGGEARRRRRRGRSDTWRRRPTPTARAGGPRLPSALGAAGRSETRRRRAPTGRTAGRASRPSWSACTGAARAPCRCTPSAPPEFLHAAWPPLSCCADLSSMPSCGCAAALKSGKGSGFRLMLLPPLLPPSTRARGDRSRTAKQLIP